MTAGWYVWGATWANWRQRWRLILPAENSLVKPAGKSVAVWCSRTPSMPPLPRHVPHDGYEIMDAPNAINGKAILCHRCGRKSFSPDDVIQVHCGNCGYHSTIQ